jgi:hypothetical protein
MEDRRFDKYMRNMMMVNTQKMMGAQTPMIGDPGMYGREIVAAPACCGTTYEYSPWVRAEPTCTRERTALFSWINYASQLRSESLLSTC